MDKDTKINEMEITDEFSMADAKESVKLIAFKLQELQKETEHGAVLITDGTDKVIGFITKKELIALVARGESYTKTTASDIMSTDFEEVLEDDTLGNIMPKISKRYPNAMVVVNDKGHCVGYFSKNDYKDALAGLGVYDKSHEPETVDDWRTRGIAMSSLGKKSEAIKCFEKSIESSDDKEKGWSDLAKRLERINRRKDAIMCMDKVLSMDADNDEALTTRGKLYAEEKTQHLAIQSYKMALDVNPKNAEAWMDMGMEQANLGEINEALKSLDQAQAINGATPEIWFRKGNIYDKVKKYDDALNCYNEAIKLNDFYEEAWFNKGIALVNLGRDSDALQCLIKILQINPTNESAREALNNYKEKGTLELA